MKTLRSLNKELKTESTNSAPTQRFEIASSDQPQNSSAAKPVLSTFYSSGRRSIMAARKFSSCEILLFGEHLSPPSVPTSSVSHHIAVDPNQSSSQTVRREIQSDHLSEILHFPARMRTVQAHMLNFQQQLARAARFVSLKLLTATALTSKHPEKQRVCWSCHLSLRSAKTLKTGERLFQGRRVTSQLIAQNPGPVSARASRIPQSSGAR